MYLERVKTKGVYYLYLRQYQVRIHYTNRETVYSFGRLETALTKLRAWQKDFSTVPKELIEKGCTKKEIDSWIKTLETGVHQKSGKKFELVV